MSDEENYYSAAYWRELEKQVMLEAEGERVGHQNKAFDFGYTAILGFTVGTAAAFIDIAKDDFNGSTVAIIAGTGILTIPCAIKSVLEIRRTRQQNRIVDEMRYGQQG